MMSDEIVTISFLGVDKRSMSAYEFFFASVKQVSCQLLDDVSQSQICLVDKDAYNIQEKYQNLRQEYPEKIILLLSLDAQMATDKNEFFLQKPVKRDDLQFTFNQIYLLLSGKEIHFKSQHKVVPNKPAIDNDFDESTQKVKINVSNNQFNVETLNDKTLADKTLADKQKNNQILTPKPNAVTANAGKLMKVANEVDFVGVQKNIDINDPTQLEKVFYNPNKSLQSIVEKVCIKSRKEDAIIQLNAFNHIFYFDYQEQRVYSNVGPGIIRPLCLMPHDNQVSYKIKDASFRDELHDIIQSNKNKTRQKNQEKQSWRMESFTWLISLWSSRGRVPRGTPLDRPVYLMQWPNMTRLAAVPHGVRIAALLYEQASNLPDVARQLDIEQRYVFAFYSACKSIGLANISRRQIDKTFVNEQPKRHKNKSILAKLLGKLLHFGEKGEKPPISKSA